MSRILVTGGAGFIGSHTCLALLERNYKVLIIDSFINSSPIALKRVKKIFNQNHSQQNNIQIVKGDLRDIKLLENIFLRAKLEQDPIEAVIHFAGLKSVSDSIKKPLEYWDNNLIGTINLLKIMDQNKCRTIVFSSSATIYKKAEKKLIDENTSISPITPYGFTKSAIEIILENIFNSESNNWRIANLRYFNPIGAHSSGLIGENPKGLPNNIFPLILKVASGEIRELEIFGNDWPTHDGTGVRDYIHVIDLAEGHIFTLDYLLKNKPVLLNLNLGTGIGSSVLDLINSFECVNKIKIPYKFVNRRDGDLPSVVANNFKAIKILKWTPKRNLELMCKDGWRWQIMNPSGY